MSCNPIPKPAMRGLQIASLRKHSVGCFFFTISAGLAWWFGVIEPRKRLYEEYERVYDVEEAAERMCKSGYFQSCPDYYKEDQ